MYSPNAFTKDTCDPEWDNFDHPCRGTPETCLKGDSSLKIGIPKPDSCWRYAFRYHLVDANESNGFMIQVVDYDEIDQIYTLGKGQEIENAMAKQVSTKVFRIYQPIHKPHVSPNYFCQRFHHDDID